MLSGAELLVRGASRLAAFLGISPLIIGLTVVAFGTSSPELATSIQSSLRGNVDLAVGNVIGSNIFNILFILGLSAIITPLTVSRQLIKLDVPLMILVSFLTLFFGLNRNISQTEGLILFLGIIFYILFLISMAKKERKRKKDEFNKEYGWHEKKSTPQWLSNFILVIVGFFMLIYGSNLFVEGSVKFAHFLGVSELVIGLTIVAGGTSLPEVATSIIASLKGEREIAVGNVVGSNIFNILTVLGFTALITPAGLAVANAAITFDIPVMLTVAIACLPIFISGGKISRWEGLLFFGYYLIYALYMILKSTNHDMLPFFSFMFWLFIMPLTSLTVIIVLIFSFRKKRRKSKSAKLVKQ